jgi:hypothetical protein
LKTLNKYLLCSSRADYHIKKNNIAEHASYRKWLWLKNNQLFTRNDKNVVICLVVNIEWGFELLRNFHVLGLALCSESVLRGLNIKGFDLEQKFQLLPLYFEEKKEFPFRGIV